MRRIAKSAGATLLLVSFVLLVAASPWLMLGISRIATNWSLLSNVGQSYGFISAVLSTLAFAAIAWSIRQQTHEASAQREEAARAMQTQILSLALNDPYLLACYPMTRGEVGDNKRFFYLNLLFWWWHYLYSAGRIPDSQLRFELTLLLRAQAGREYVTKQLEFQRTIGQSFGKGFFKIVDESLTRANSEGPAIPFAFKDVSVGGPAKEADMGTRRLERFGYVGAGVALGWLAHRMSRSARNR